MLEVCGVGAHRAIQNEWPGRGTWPRSPDHQARSSRPHSREGRIHLSSTCPRPRQELMESLMNLSRRQFLGGGLAGASLACLRVAAGSSSVSDDHEHGARRVRAAGSIPRPGLAAGTDLVPQIEHFVVVMMENHSFDNILGLIGRGDGFTIGPDGHPTATNPDGNGNSSTPSTCRPNARRTASATTGRSPMRPTTAAAARDL